MATTSLAPMTDADGMVYLPNFGACLMTRTRAFEEAEAMADENGAPCGIWQRASWFTVCEHAPESITPDPMDSGWELIAVMDPAPTDVTDEQILSLRAEAAQAGDFHQCIICDIALGQTDFGAMAVTVEMTTDEARAECARVIADAAAQQD